MKNQEDLLNITRTMLNLKNDAALSRALCVKPSVINKLRHGKTPISAALLIALHEKTDISIAELKRITGYRGPSERVEEAANAERTAGTGHSFPQS